MWWKELDPLNCVVWGFALIGCAFFWYVVIAFTLGAL